MRGSGAAFGRLLVDQPLMRNVLADLALECESHIALVMRLARAFDAQEDEAESMLRRVLTPVAKYWVCKRAPAVIAETHGGPGRQWLHRGGPDRAPFSRGAIELDLGGSGNIMCLDVLRAFAREPRTREVLDVLSREQRPRCALRSFRR